MRYGLHRRGSGTRNELAAAKVAKTSDNAYKYRSCATMHTMWMSWWSDFQSTTLYLLNVGKTILIKIFSVNYFAQFEWREEKKNAVMMKREIAFRDDPLRVLFRGSIIFWFCWWLRLPLQLLNFFYNYKFVASLRFSRTKYVSLFLRRPLRSSYPLHFGM